MIPVTESASPTRFAPLFPQGAQSQPLVEAITARALNLKDGQVVQATVQSQGDQLALMLRGRLIGVPNRSDWEIGRRMSFLTQVNDDGSITLYALSDTSPASPAPAAKAAPSTVVAQVQLFEDPNAPGFMAARTAGSDGSFSRLASLLYRQPGLPDLQQLLAPDGLSALLAKVTNHPEFIARWRAIQLAQEQTTPDAVRLAVITAMGSEANIARYGRPSPVDTKQLLYQLLAVLGDQTDAVVDTADLQHVRRAIDDLEASQLNALQAQRAGEMAIKVLLPYPDANPVELSFERGPGAGGKDGELTVSVHSNSIDFGELWLKAQLRDENQIDLTMWALRESVIAMAQAGADELGLSLLESGLTMRSFHAHHGARPQPAPAAHPPAEPGVVLDILV
jgi:hypothetical protein